MFWHSMFHSITKEGEKGISEKIMIYFELRNTISISCVVCSHGSRNNIEQIF